MSRLAAHHHSPAAARLAVTWLHRHPPFIVFLVAWTFFSLREKREQKKKKERKSSKAWPRRFSGKGSGFSRALIVSLLSLPASFSLLDSRTNYLLRASCREGSLVTRLEIRKELDGDVYGSGSSCLYENFLQFRREYYRFQVEYPVVLMPGRRHLSQWEFAFILIEFYIYNNSIYFS